MLKTYTLFLILTVFILTGCSAPSAGPDMLPTLTTAVPTSSKTATATLTCTPEPTGTASPSPTITITPSPTFSSDFSSAEIAGVSFLADWQQFHINIDAHSDINGEYNATIEGNPYTCQNYQSRPQWLSCDGPPVAVERWLTLKIYENSTGRAVYETEFMVPLSAVIPDEWIENDE